MVPEGWSTESISSLAKVVDCKHRTPKYVDNGVPLVSPGSIKWGPLDLETPKKWVTQEEYLSLMDHCTVEVGDLVMSRNQSVGIVSYVSSLKPFVLGQDTVLIKPEQVEKKYLFFKIQSEIVQRRISKLAGGSTFLRINLADIRRLKVDLPPLPEQTKIAKILTTWDKAITTTEQLLSNSQQQKKALMQKLLTGKKRLTDEYGTIFSGIWEWVTLDSICDIKGGKRLPKGVSLSDRPTPYPYIRVSDMHFGGVKLDDIKYVPEEVAPKIKNYRISKNDLFITVAGTLGIVGAVPNELDGANLTENADKLTNIKCNKVFLLYVMKSSIVKRYIEAESTQNAQPKLALKKVRNFKIPKPSEKEQQKIAQVLTAADGEIETLQQKLHCLKQEKKALMQQLLTGKLRVKVDTEAA